MFEPDNYDLTGTDPVGSDQIRTIEQQLETELSLWRTNAAAQQQTQRVLDLLVEVRAEQRWLHTVVEQLLELIAA